ncbi:MAG: aminoacyl-tRNA hydrolase, partial [Pseudonocardia sp.]
MTPGSATGSRALVVGLANPGPEYAETRHNVGVRVVELLAARAGGGRFSKHKANADVLEGRLAGRRAVLAVPRTYMNVSGGPVAGLLRYYGVAPTDLVVVHDDLDLGFGVVRLKQGELTAQGTVFGDSAVLRNRAQSGRAAIRRRRLPS